MGYGHRRRILIYVSGGGNEGMGHIIRSSHLANALQNMGHDARVSFAHGQEPLIPDWLGVPLLPVEMDYLRTKNPVLAAKCCGFDPDIFVLDVMWPQHDWLCAPKNVLIVGAGWSITKKIAEAADVLVYQTGWRTPGVVSGPDFLMLGPAYEKRAGVRAVDVLVSFGAGIPKEYEQAARMAFPDALIPEEGEMLCGLQAHSRIHVGSMGMSTYESIAMGCVPVVVCRSTDHEDTARKLEKLGVLVNCGILADCSPQSMVAVAKDVLSEPALLERMSLAGQKMIDGKGLARVAERIMRV